MYDYPHCSVHRFYTSSFIVADASFISTTSGNTHFVKRQIKLGGLLRCSVDDNIVGENVRFFDSEFLSWSMGVVFSVRNHDTLGSPPLSVVIFPTLIQNTPLYTCVTKLLTHPQTTHLCLFSHRDYSLVVCVRVSSLSKRRNLWAFTKLKRPYLQLTSRTTLSAGPTSGTSDPIP